MGRYHHFTGDCKELNKIIIHRHILERKLKDCIYQLETMLGFISKESKTVSKKINNKNPVYWEELSTTLEVIQLEYIKIQTLISHCHISGLFLAIL